MPGFTGSHDNDTQENFSSEIPIHMEIVEQPSVSELEIEEGYTSLQDALEEVESCRFEQDADGNTVIVGIENVRGKLEKSYQFLHKEVEDGDYQGTINVLNTAYYQGIGTEYVLPFIEENISSIEKRFV